MEDQRKFELDDDVLDSVAGGGAVGALVEEDDTVPVVLPHGV